MNDDWEDTFDDNIDPKDIPELHHMETMAYWSGADVSKRFRYHDVIGDIHYSENYMSGSYIWFALIS